jgi:hypothetical protein
MRGVPFTAAIALVLLGATLPASAETREAPTDSPEKTASPPSDPAAAPSPQPAAKPDSSQLGKLPQDAVGALVRASAAYEYGDLNQVVEAARLITEGSVPATQDQQALAYRLLGIGLYLTNRPLGAETAFTELLRRDPRARLDPTTTRPELVAYFESIRQQQLAHQRSTRKLYWNFIPPIGQFQNEDNGKAWTLLALGFVAGATSATTYVLKKSWDLPNDRSKHEDAANAFRTVNAVSGAVLIALYVYGVVDGLVGYGRPVDDSRLPVSLHYFPGGGGLGISF